MEKCGRRLRESVASECDLLSARPAIFAATAATSQRLVQLFTENSIWIKHALELPSDCASIGSVQDEFCASTFLNSALLIIVQRDSKT
jgi:hypothetical protein